MSCQISFIKAHAGPLSHRESFKGLGKKSFQNYQSHFIQVLNSTTLHSYPTVCTVGNYSILIHLHSSASDHIMTEAAGTVLTHRVKLPKMLSTGFKYHNKHSNWPCYLCRQIVVFVTVKVYDSEL